MTSVKPKLSSLRQYSLRSASPQRPVLKKQLSVDNSTYSKTKQHPPTRLAWQETNNNTNDNDNDNVQIIAKKCSEYQKLKSAVASPQRDPILYSRQELAERLRKVWKERETNNNNKSIDIFLARSVSIDNDENVSISRESSILNEKNTKIQITSDKNIEAITNTLNNQVSNELKQKNLTKKISLVISPLFHDAIDLNDATDITENNENVFKNDTANFVTQKQSEDKKNIITPTFEILNKNGDKTNPLSVELKRENFRKSNKKMFSEDTSSVVDNSTNVSNFRPPLIRAQSVPTTPDSLHNNYINKNNKFPVKRRVKTAIIRKKNSVDNQCNDGITNTKQTHKNKTSKKKNILPRCRSATTTSEIVTMVSITSPPHSDTEENIQKTAANLAKIRKQNLEKKAEMNAKLEAQRLKTLKKIVKQVSFQPTLVAPPVRNHSANSYLSRRGSVAPVSFRTILQSSLQMTSPTALMNEREKRTQITPSSNDEEREPKRRFVQNGLEGESLENINYSNVEKSDNTIRNDKFENEDIDVQKTENVINNSNKTEDGESQKSSEILTESNSNSQEEPKFDNPKERQCWKLFKKMHDKGVDVSYDTILKGILTPTEYRLRKKLENMEQVKKDDESN